MVEDASWVADAMSAAVPWVTTAGIEFGEITTERAVAVLPDRSDQHNHVGGPHAAVIFGLGETASGAVGLAAFAAALATPLPVHSEIRYLRVARGDLRAEAVLTRPAGEVLAELRGSVVGGADGVGRTQPGTRPEFAVEVDVTDAEGRTTTRMTVVWTLRPNRTG